MTNVAVRWRISNAARLFHGSSFPEVCDRNRETDCCSTQPRECGCIYRRLYVSRNRRKRPMLRRAMLYREGCAAPADSTLPSLSLPPLSLSLSLSLARSLCLSLRGLSVERTAEIVKGSEVDRMAPRVIAAETIAAISYSANSLSSHPRRFGTVGTPGNVHPGNFGVVLLVPPTAASIVEVEHCPTFR